MSNLWYTDGHIVQANIKVNDFYFGQPPFNTPSWKDVTLCRGLGQALGLSLQDGDLYNPNLGTCMVGAADGLLCGCGALCGTAVMKPCVHPCAC